MLQSDMILFKMKISLGRANSNMKIPIGTNVSFRNRNLEASVKTLNDAAEAAN